MAYLKARSLVFLGLIAATINPAIADGAKDEALQVAAEKLLNTKEGNERLFRRIMGRADERQYFVTVRGNLFAFRQGGPALPLASVYGFWTSKMIEDKSTGGYLIRNAYCGTFVPFGTEKIVGSFRNPVNGAMVDARVSKRSGGNIVQLRRPSGIYYRTKETGNIWDRNLYPFEPTDGPNYPWQIVGDEIYMRENLVDFKSAKPRYEDMTFSARLSDLMNDKMDFVPSSRIYNSTHLASDYPWFNFGADASTTYLTVHAAGRKLKSSEALPKALLEFATKECPSHLDGSVFDIPLDEVLVR